MFLTPFDSGEHERHDVTRRVGNLSRGILLIVAGVATIPGSFLLSMIFFHDPLEPQRLLFAVVATVVLIAAGILSIRASRPRRP